MWDSKKSQNGDKNSGRNGDSNEIGQNSDHIKNAFKVLMETRGDTQKITPVKIKVKRLEKKEKTTPKTMEKWLRKWPILEVFWRQGGCFLSSILCNLNWIFLWIYRRLWALNVHGYQASHRRGTWSMKIWTFSDEISDFLRTFFCRRWAGRVDRVLIVWRLILTRILADVLSRSIWTIETNFSGNFIYKKVTIFQKIILYMYKNDYDYVLLQIPWLGHSICVEST